MLDDDPTTREDLLRHSRNAGTDCRRNANRSRLTGTPDLPAESLDTWEIAYLGNWKDRRLSLDVRHFRERVGDRLFQIDSNVFDTVGDSVNPIQDIRIDGDPADRVVGRRHWVSLQLEF